MCFIVKDKFLKKDEKMKVKVMLIAVFVTIMTGSSLAVD